jgi:hypothetical protein
LYSGEILIRGQRWPAAGFAVFSAVDAEKSDYLKSRRAKAVCDAENGEKPKAENQRRSSKGLLKGNGTVMH